jgi:phage-related protein
MATFPAITPTYGAQKASQPATRTVKFGDGYEHRTVFGLPTHANPKQWNLTWEVSETDADTIEAFLDARAADSASFDWTPLGEATTYKWICPQWSKSIPYLNRATISATFRQVFEP